MRLVLAAVGSRGDIEPMVALACGLRAAGHSVEICGSPNGRWIAEREGIDFVDLGVDLRRFARANARALVDRPGDTARVAARLIDGVVRAQIEVLPGRLAGADLLVGSSVTAGAESVAEAAGVEYRTILFTPQMLPSAAHPPATIAQHWLPGWLNRVCWWATEATLDLLVRRSLVRHRRSLGLEPPERSVYRTFWPSDRMLVASEAALAAVPPDAGDVPQTGALHLTREEPLSPRLQQFLDDGPAPTYVGFGSMPAGDPALATELVRSAGLRAGKRLVVSAGWAGLGEGVESSDESILWIGSEPHGELFGRVAGVVHHGGAGTTAAAFRAGVPQLVVPHLFDQFYWGERVRRAGLGPAPIRRRRLTVSRLAAALIELVDPVSGYADRAAGLRCRRSQAPIAAAVRALCSIARGGLRGVP